MDNSTQNNAARARTGGSLHRAGRMEGQKWRNAANKWFDKLAVKSALGKATDKEEMILDRLQKIRVPVSQSQIVADARAEYQMRLALKTMRRLQLLSRNPTVKGDS